MIAMEMAYENTGYTGRGDVSKDKLPLRPFTRIKQKPFSIPAQQIGAMVPQPCWLLARTP
jgi:hypothetical protein